MDDKAEELNHSSKDYEKLKKKELEYSGNVICHEKNKPLHHRYKRKRGIPGLQQDSRRKVWQIKVKHDYSGTRGT